MTHEEPFINGELLRLRREERGWVLNDLATRACMSVKQVRQLEEGGVSAFYSVAVKTTAAKKVGALLGLSAEEVFAQALAAVVPNESVDGVVASDQPLTNEEGTTVEKKEISHASLLPASQDRTETPSEPTESKTKPSLGWIAVLFASALGVVAYLQPQEEPVTEPAPPVQVLPADAQEPASAPETVASEVVSVTASAPAPAQKPASVASSVASAVAVRPASAVVLTTPASASKSP